MKNRVFIFLSGVSAFVLIFLFTDEFTAGFSAGLSNCAGVVIPSLFPFLVASSLVGSGELSKPLKKIADPLTQTLFGLPADCLPAIIIGQLGGYLSGASSARSLYSSGKISRTQAQKLVLFCINPGIGFSVNAVGNALLGSREAGKILLVSLCISSALIGMLVRFIPDKSEKSAASERIHTDFSAALVSSVNFASYSMLNCCGFVCFFSGVSSVMSRIIKNGAAKLFAVCILEVTSGCAAAADRIPLSATAAVCAFGSLCVHMQIFSLAKDLKIKVSLFYLFRLLHSAVSFAVCGAILHFHPIEEQVMFTVSENIRLWSFSAPAAISLMFMCALLILDLDNNKKLC